MNALIVNDKGELQEVNVISIDLSIMDNDKEALSLIKDLLNGID